ncbi:hypothetical protein chiPu_0019371 [Chiloscyllium punctatum]|uniref:Uncharacterized protein n=1 Tax=Chiloscyllium punctatum TaxID=137246 RepID=A0A401RRP1_CHIPU|nr:hypothetical protein [Chiloscyllium punctatum]
MQTNRMTNLTLPEMLTSRFISVTNWRGQNDGPTLEHLDLELKQYMRQLTIIPECTHTQEKLRVPVSAKEMGLIKPGDQVRNLWKELKANVGSSPWCFELCLIRRDAQKFRFALAESGPSRSSTAAPLLYYYNRTSAKVLKPCLNEDT